ncbi:MAG: STAS domain-containing protein [Spirochaetaceae bacterium]|jgi:anti-anti-sigma factor|nr:STAS domain-containing protein [Spirochaetaceae bacterium]
MTIQKALDPDTNQLTLTLEGRLDTTTAPELEKELKASLGGVDSLIFDFMDLVYLSSAGIRVIIMAQKLMKPPKEMAIRNVNDIVYEVFEMTGLTDVIKISILTV